MDIRSSLVIYREETGVTGAVDAREMQWYFLTKTFEEEKSNEEN